MSDIMNCSKCGKKFGASWADTSSLCSRCKCDPDWEKNLYAENDKLKRKIDKLSRQNLRLKKTVKKLQGKK